jgi:hypothetical protein
MKKNFMQMFFALIVLAVFIIVGKAQTPATEAETIPQHFNGIWVLDTTKTKMQNMPVTLKGFNMIVAQNSDKINVKSKIDGKVDVERFGAKREVSSSNPSGFAGDREPVAAKINYGGTLALYYTPSEAVYNLDGKEVKMELKSGEKNLGSVKIRAKSEKEGKLIRITQIRREKTMQGEVEIFVRERWELSSDGKTLKFHRQVEMPTALDDVEMVFIRQTP